ncbi:MAG: response regulator [Bacteroidales bacterium]|nr:response regulator [Bacteroidales bacterium]
MEKIKILLVDDDPDFADQMLFYLNKFGYDTMYLPSQRSAESRLKDIQFDLAILDLMMEEDDSGLQLARKIKANSPEIPIILLTAITNETGYSFSQEFKNSPELLPIDKYCEKGIRPDVLNKIIEQLITIKK